MKNTLFIIVIGVTFLFSCSQSPKLLIENEIIAGEVTMTASDYEGTSPSDLIPPLTHFDSLMKARISRVNDSMVLNMTLQEASNFGISEEEYNRILEGLKICNKGIESAKANGTPFIIAVD